MTKRYQLSEGIRLGLNALSSLLVAGWALVALYHLWNHNWDAATAFFAGAILMSTFIRD